MNIMHKKAASSCTKRNHINFIPSCRIVITKLSIFDVIYDNVHNLFMEHSVDINYGCNLKCIFVHTHFFCYCFLLSSRLTLHNNEKEYLCVECTFSKNQKEGFAVEFMFCECFYAKKILLPFANIKRGKKKGCRSDRKKKSFNSFCTSE